MLFVVLTSKESEETYFIAVISDNRNLFVLWSFHYIKHNFKLIKWITYCNHTKLLWYERKKTLWDILLYENSQPVKILMLIISFADEDLHVNVFKQGEITQGTELIMFKKIQEVQEERGCCVMLTINVQILHTCGKRTHCFKPCP